MKYAKWLFFGLAIVAVWSAVALYLALEGVWIRAVVEERDTLEFYNWAVDELEQKNAGNSALVLLEDGEVAQQFFAGAQQTVDEDTLFPTASFSKWVTTLAIMSLVEKNVLDLDAPVANYLTRWRLPDSEFNNDEVTVRRLLSHTAGLTDGLGFGDYEANEILPETEEELRNPRASSAESVEVAVGIQPGTEFKYSGGGYLILQLLVEELTGLTFQDFAKGSLLSRAQMRRSSYEYLAGLENASFSFDSNGTRAKAFQYASPAATGLSSSASDLSNLARKILANDGEVLSSASIKALREPHGFMMGAAIWGLGTILYAPTDNGDFVFGHDGANSPAINSTLRLNPETGDGIVLLVSGHPSLASNIGSEWVLWQTGRPDFLSTERALRSALLPSLLGGMLLLLVVIWLARRRPV